MEMASGGRIYPRFKVINWPVTILTPDKSIDGIARNFSSTGTFIYYDQQKKKPLPFPRHTQVALVVRVPSRLPLLIQAEVIWSKIINSRDGKALIGMGLRFTDVFFNDRQFLREMVAKHATPEV